MESVKVSVSNNIAVVTLDTHPLNVISDREMHSLKTIFTGLGDRRDVRAVVLTGAGERAFCAGVNLKTLNDRGSQSLAAEMDMGRAFRDACWSIYECPVPVIGAINGPAIGAGLALASVCDVLFASENATFATTEIDVGLLGAYSHLKMMIGRYKAREYFFSGEVITAAEMMGFNAVKAVCSSADLMPRAIELAESFAIKSPHALRFAKEAMNGSEYLPLKEAYHLEQHYTERLANTSDAQEARSAYFEKRSPIWAWDSEV